MVRLPVLIPLLALLLCLLGCNDQARTRPLNRSQALAKTEVLEVKVVKVWNVVTDALDHDREPGISHYVEVDVISGPNAGKQLTLPYDEWNVGKPPPEVDATIVMAPADWVKRSSDSRGKSMGSW